MKRGRVLNDPSPVSTPFKHLRNRARKAADVGLQFGFVLNDPGASLGNLGPRCPGSASMGMMIGEGRQVRSFQGNLIHALRTIMGAYKPESIVRDAISGFLWKEMKGQVRTDEESCAAGIVGLTAALVKLLA